MEEALRSSQKFVKRDSDYALIDMGFGFSVMQKKLLPVTWNKDECDMCAGRNCFNYWDIQEDKWVG